MREACELAVANWEERRKVCEAFRERAMAALAPLNPRYNGDLERCVPHTLNVAFEGVGQEALIVGHLPRPARRVPRLGRGSGCVVPRSKVVLSRQIQSAGVGVGDIVIVTVDDEAESGVGFHEMWAGFDLDVGDDEVVVL